jgi:hypothetical protein
LRKKYKEFINFEQGYNLYKEINCEKYFETSSKELIGLECIIEIIEIKLKFNKNNEKKNNNNNKNKNNCIII